MDDGDNRTRRPASGPRGPQSAREARRHEAPGGPPVNQGGDGGGLLSRYTPDPDDARQPAGPSRQPRSGPPTPYDPRTGNGRPGSAGPSGGGLLSRARNDAFAALTSQAKRIGAGVRRAAGAMRHPQSGDWRASDFDPQTLDSWDRHDEVPFDLPDQPEFEDERARLRQRDGGRGSRDARRDGGKPFPSGWEDDEWEDAGWETGTWDTGWATDFGPSMDYAGRYDDDSGALWMPGRGGRDDGRDDSDPVAESLNTLARLGAVHAPMSRRTRFRLLVRTRPAAAAMLAFFVLGFMLTCCAPVIPILRLAYDTNDALRRVDALQGLMADQAALLNAATLKEAQAQVDGLSHDLFEINSAINIAGAPLSGISSSVRNYRLLTRIGFDLTTTADESIQVAQTILTPLQGGALAADSSAPGLTTDDINQAKQVLADAQVRLADALVAYQQLDRTSLSGPLAKFDKYLALLPSAPAIVAEMQRLLDSAPGLLGIGQPAYYLVVAMDRSELRPAGGFMGNYGILTLDGGRQSKTHPLTLEDTYNLDHDYYDTFLQKAGLTADNPQCVNAGPQPPNYYWWWPYRQDGACQIAWGLRDSGLSPDFPTNAQTAMQIVEDTPNKVPGGAQLQGVIAFDPVLIEELLQITGPIKVPEWGATVTPQNLEYTIHKFQLGGATPKNKPRKGFTHDMATEMLGRIKAMHGDQLKKVFKVAVDAMKAKDLQIYFRDPQAELILRQLGLSAEIARGNGDGFFVVDTNDGGNKANAFVSEHQTDYVTLLPDGGALHRLQISVTYQVKGPVWDGTEQQQDYIDMQRTYLPGDATILGYSGFVPTDGVHFADCAAGTEITDCTSEVHLFHGPTTSSDVPGRTMVFGSLFISCGPSFDPTHTVETLYDFTHTQSGSTSVTQYDAQNGCVNHPEGRVARTQNIYITYYTPHAFTMDADGHGTYTELVEKQAGASDFLTGVGNTLTVYVDTSQLRAKHPNIGTDPTINNETQWAALIQGKKPAKGYDKMKLLENTVVSVAF